MSAARSVGEALLVVVSPTALTLDGESVRVARDVLGAAFAVKLVVPRSLAELERTLSRRGAKRLVVIGDDRALHQVVQLLHEHSELGSGPIGMIPVGKGEKVALARSLGAATLPVDAARAVRQGCERTLGLLVDESGGVVLGGLRIPGRETLGTGFGAAAKGAGRAAVVEQSRGGAGVPGPGVSPMEARSLRANKIAAGRVLQLPSACLEWGGLLGRAARNVAAQIRAAQADPGQALRVEADGRLLADLDRKVGLITAWTPGARADGSPEGADGLMEVLVSAPAGGGSGSGADGGAVRMRAHRITVTGGPASSFSYEADSAVVGPVQQRTWTVEPSAWRLTVPPAA